MFLNTSFCAFVAKLADRCFSWFPAAMLVPTRLYGQQHGVSIQISINLGKKILLISRLRKIAVT